MSSTEIKNTTNPLQLIIWSNLFLNQDYEQSQNLKFSTANKLKIIKEKS